jgi:hypothetical protein
MRQRRRRERPDEDPLAAVDSGGGPIDDVVVGGEEVAEDAGDAGFGLADQLHLVARPKRAADASRARFYGRSVKRISR